MLSVVGEYLIELLDQLIMGLLRERLQGGCPPVPAVQNRRVRANEFGWLVGLPGVQALQGEIGLQIHPGSELHAGQVPGRVAVRGRDQLPPAGDRDVLVVGKRGSRVGLHVEIGPLMRPLQRGQRQVDLQCGLRALRPRRIDRRTWVRLDEAAVNPHWRYVTHPARQRVCHLQHPFISDRGAQGSRKQGPAVAYTGLVEHRLEVVLNRAG